jgi:hypothetical protein
VASWLRKLVVNRVALVDRGANQKADIVLMKREVDKQQPAPNDVHVDGMTARQRRLKPPMQKQGEITCPTCGGEGTIKGGNVECPECGGTGMVEKRSFSSDQRDSMASSGQAMPDGSYPIGNTGDLKNAIQAYGRSKNPSATKAHIIRRARALGATDQLPEDWNVSKVETANTTGGGDRSMATIDKESLSDDVREYVEKLEADLAKVEEAVEETPPANGNGPEETPDEGAEEEGTEEVTPEDTEAEAEVMKSLPEAVRKRIEDAESKAAEAITKAKAAEAKAEAEVAKRETREAIEHVQKWASLGYDPIKFGPQFREVQKATPEAAKEIERILSAAYEQLRQSNLFSEVGNSYASPGSDPLSKLQAIAKEFVANGEASNDAEAWDKAVMSEAGQRLYGEYSLEKMKGGRS